MMNEIEYKDVLDIEWTLMKAELAAKTKWDEVVIFKDDDDCCLYEVRYEVVKELRAAQKKLRALFKVIRNSDIKVKHRVY
jgi:hypothetical protein